MQASALKGSNANYFYFPNEEDTVLSHNKFFISYIGAELETKQKVICKRISPALFDNKIEKLKFLIEASASLQHPSFAKTIDLVIQDNEVFLIQEFVQGHSLKELIKSKEYIDYKLNPFFIKVIIQTLDAISFMHSKGLCHCDIKPSNIMIVDKDFSLDINDPKIKIIDFCNLKQSYQSDNIDSKRKNYNIIYSSPEQILGYEELIGKHTDIFSIGLLLYEVIAKEPALKTSNPELIRRMQLSSRIDKHFRIEDDLYNIISKATVKPVLAKSEKFFSEDELKIKLIHAINARYSSAEDFMQELFQLLN